MTERAGSKRSREGGWATIVASDQSQNTSNPIRKIVDAMKADKPSSKSFIPLSIGDPTIDGNLLPPQNLEDKLIENIRSHKFNGYPPSVGYPAARAAVAKYWSNNFMKNNAEGAKALSPDQVILSSGASHAILMAIGALANAGDNILLPAPCFSLYTTILDNHGIKSSFYSCNPDRSWEANLDEIRSQANSRTKAILITNPSNPCGSNFSNQHVKDILALANELRLPVIADEIYAGLVFSGEQFTSVADIVTDVPRIIIGGLAKNYIVPGWRMGWLLTVDPLNLLTDVFKGMVALSTLLVGPNSIVQSGMETALNESPADYLPGLKKTLEDNAMCCYEIFKNAKGLTPVKPQGAMYLMVKIDFSMFKGFTNDVEFAKLLMEEENVQVLPGTIFRAPGFIRIVFTKPLEQLREAAQRIQECCARHTA